MDPALPADVQAHDNMKRKRESALIPTRPLTSKEAQTLWFATVGALLEAGKPLEETVATAAASKADHAPTVPAKGSAAAAQTIAAARQETAAALQKQKLERLVQHLHMLLVHDEEAANTVMVAIGDLPYDQLQTIEGVLDEMGRFLLSDFIRLTAFNTTDPFVRWPIGEDRLTWHERTKPKAEEHANDAPDLAALAALHASDAPPHIWLADVKRAQAAAAAQQHVQAALDSADWAGSGRWQAPKAEEVAAEIVARRESVMPAEGPAQSSPQRLNAWQRAAKAASLFGADGLLARRSMVRPRQSAIATQHKQGAQNRPSISVEDHKQRGAPSYTGLPLSSWGTKAVSQPAAKEGVADRPHTAPVGRRFSAVFAGGHGLPFEVHAAPAPTPSLDAIVLSRGPGPYVSPELQRARR